MAQVCASTIRDRRNGCGVFGEAPPVKIGEFIAQEIVVAKVATVPP
jgi:hypothetical protein